MLSTAWLSTVPRNVPAFFFIIPYVSLPGNNTFIQASFHLKFELSNPKCESKRMSDATQ